MMRTYPYTVKNLVTSTFSLAKLSPNQPVFHLFLI